MGKGKKPLLSLFGFKKARYVEEEAEPEHSKYERKVRPSNDDNDYWYAKPDVDRKAKEYIEKVRRGMSEPSST
ncbi:hypothetical protein ACMD2_02511 [Ananas comosus]|uniref:Uncharacterized protein n=1 Tax=Ananas comosus TaxID=4615 RepID=A0A199V8V7_ANACO|nr:hypothetical protein ACMD2_02511 [Ananas comosus]